MPDPPSSRQVVVHEGQLKDLAERLERVTDELAQIQGELRALTAEPAMADPPTPQPPSLGPSRWVDEPVD